MNKNILPISIILLITLAAFFVYPYLVPEKVVGNKLVLTEINRLLLPLDAKNISERDFSTLKELVKTDHYASHETEELAALARYREYSHIGHGLGFLYGYVQTGKEPLCPGHLLAHYYVFNKHGEIDMAEDNLLEARALISQLDSGERYNLSSLEFFHTMLNRIDSVNRDATEDEIFTLAESSCVKD